MIDEYRRPLPLRLRDPDRLMRIQKTYFKSHADDLVDKARFLGLMRDMSIELLEAHYDFMGPVDQARADATRAKLEEMKWVI